MFSMITKFNQYKMNEEYGLSDDRTKQQFMIKEIVDNINPNFDILFDDLYIRITADNNLNTSLAGKYQKRLDIHKVYECIEQLIEIEKKLIDSGIIKNQFTNFDMDRGHLRLSFSLNPSVY